MEIAGHTFNGPYGLDREIIDRAAVYVILDGDDKIVDVGQTGEAGTRLANHERKSCWDTYGGKWVAVSWMPSDRYTKEDRENLEKKIRGSGLVCGVR